MEMITNTMKQIAETQQKMVTEMMENTNSMMPDFVKNMFGTYTETIKKSFTATETTKQVYENNIKFHKAFIAYHTAIIDMMTSINDNIEIVKTQTKTKTKN